MEVPRALGAGKQRCALGCSPQFSPKSSHAPSNLPAKVLGEKDARIAGSHSPSHTGVPGFSLGSPGVQVVPLLFQKIQLSPLEPLYPPSCAWEDLRPVGQAWQGQPSPGGGRQMSPSLWRPRLAGGAGDRCWQLQPATH